MGRRKLPESEVKAQFINFRVPPDLMRKLKREAERNERSVSGQMRWILANAVCGSNARQ